MRNSKLTSNQWVRLIVFWTAVLYGLGASAADLAQQSSQGGGVTVRAKPADVSGKATVWLFQVALDTHSGDLGDDLAATAVMVDAAGKKYSAVGWEGDASGGHHRKGVLRFKALSPQPESLELLIQRPGEAAPRAFRWQLK